MGRLLRAFAEGLSGRGDEKAGAQLAEALRVRICDRCGLSFGGGEGSFVQHLGDDGRGGTRCLPIHVFESVLTESGGIYYARGTEPRAHRRERR